MEKSNLQQVQILLKPKLNNYNFDFFQTDTKERKFAHFFNLGSEINLCIHSFSPSQLGISKSFYLNYLLS